MNFKNSIVCLFLMWIGGVAYGQQDSQYTQYMYDPTIINPSYAGSRDNMTFFGLYRTQWVGLDGAPVSGTFSAHTPINYSNIGLGVSVANDKIGPSNETNISADFSYTIPTSENYKLAFGLKATGNLLNIDYTKLDNYDPTDPRFAENISNKFSPNIGAGVFYYSDKSYFGLSVPALLETTHFDKTTDYNSSSSYVAKEKIHSYFMAGHVMDLSYDIQFKPALLLKMTNNAPLQLDLSANFMFNENFTAGIAYRMSASVSVMVGFKITDGLSIGYAYDADTTKLANYNSGSHEIFLRFELFDGVKRIPCPRFF